MGRCRAAPPVLMFRIVHFDRRLALEELPPKVSALNSRCSRKSLSRVAERAALPAMLFTIHFGGFKNIVFIATPRPLITFPGRIRL